MKLIIFVLATVVFSSNVFAEGNSKFPVKVGDKAPDFKLIDDSGTERALSEFIGKKVVVYFYPKNDTPGCTKQACSFRDNYGIYEKKGIIVIGISYDSPKSHKKFKQKYNLPFILLSDNKKKVSKAYGASRIFIAKRYTYLINEQSIIVRIFKDVNVTEHADEVLAAFEKAKKEFRNNKK
jgi:thioredoxin-dependent peroxiredoxin